VKSLAAGHAELASHLATGLGRDAEGLAVPVGNHHGLHGIAGIAVDREQILAGPVGGLGLSERKGDTDLILFRETFPPGLGDIRPVSAETPGIVAVNVEALNIFEDGTTVTPEMMMEKGLAKAVAAGIKILGNGELKKNLTVQAQKFSNSAIDKIVAAGGKAEVV